MLRTASASHRQSDQRLSAHSVRVDPERFGTAERACHVREAYLGLILGRMPPVLPQVYRAKP